MTRAMAKEGQFKADLHLESAAESGRAGLVRDISKRDQISD